MKLGPLILLGLFAAAIVSAWAWFNAAPPPDAAGIRLEARTNIAGHTFIPEPLGRGALELLSTPDVVNGFFAASNSAKSDGKEPQPVRVFAAEWTAAHAQGMTVVQHTPDICWVGAGWKPIDIGQPKQVEIEVPVVQPPGSSASAPKTVKLPFECRVFLSPDGHSRELVLWCTLVSGRVLPEQSRFDPGKEQSDDLTERERQLAAGRRLTAGYFAEALKHRLRARGTKQFARLSAPVDGAWTEPLSELQTFASEWLESSAVR